MRIKNTYTSHKDLQLIPQVQNDEERRKITYKCPQEQQKAILTLTPSSKKTSCDNMKIYKDKKLKNKNIINNDTKYTVKVEGEEDTLIKNTQRTAEEDTKLKSQNMTYDTYKIQNNNIYTTHEDPQLILQVQIDEEKEKTYICLQKQQKAMLTLIPSSSKTSCDSMKIYKDKELKNTNTINKNSSKYTLKVEGEEIILIKNTQRTAEEDINAKCQNMTYNNYKCKNNITYTINEDSQLIPQVQINEEKEKIMMNNPQE